MGYHRSIAKELSQWISTISCMNLTLCPPSSDILEDFPPMYFQNKYMGHIHIICSKSARIRCINFDSVRIYDCFCNPYDPCTVYLPIYLP